MCKSCLQSQVSLTLSLWVQCSQKPFVLHGNWQSKLKILPCILCWSGAENELRSRWASSWAGAGTLGRLCGQMEPGKRYPKQGCTNVCCHSGRRESELCVHWRVLRKVWCYHSLPHVTSYTCTTPEGPCNQYTVIRHQFSANNTTILCKQPPTVRLIPHSSCTPPWFGCSSFTTVCACDADIKT